MPLRAQSLEAANAELQTRLASVSELTTSLAASQAEARSLQQRLDEAAVAAEASNAEIARLSTNAERLAAESSASIAQIANEKDSLVAQLAQVSRHAVPRARVFMCVRLFVCLCVHGCV